MAELDKNEVVKWEVSDISNSGNPICQSKRWDKDVVVIIDQEKTIDIGDRIEFVIKRTNGDHYRALLKDESTISKPDYKSRPNIPIQHDGKHGQSVGDTRSESHATRSVDDRR